MKKILVISTILLVNAFSTEVKQEYLDNIDKYKYLESNTADVKFAKKYEERANKELSSKYEYLNKYGKDERLKKKLKNNFEQKYNIYEPTEKQKREFKQKFEGLTKVKDIKSLKKDNTNSKEDTEIDMYEMDTEVLEVGEVIEVVEDEETLELIEEIEAKQKEKIQSEKNAFENLKYQNSLLDRKGYFTKKIDQLQKEFEEYNKSNMTIMFFISSDIRLESLKGFVEHIKKLRRRGYNITGRVMFRGWINDEIDGIANWLKQKEKDGLSRTPHVKYQFHPWAFRYFSLNKVPAYALSSCKEDFRFRDCDNKYLMKGDISLVEFFNILKEHHKEYEKVYFDLIEVE